MSLPNGVYIIQGEISLVVTAMRRTTRYSSHGRHQDDDGDQLLSSFSQLKDVLNNITDLEELEPNVFLSPFLDVIRSEDTTGPITGLALSSINKFLSYNLIDHTVETAGAAIENIADAVTHARFVGTDPSSDEVILMKILHVLRTLLLCPAGVLLTNESVCEIMQSCFRICFEMRLSELLRKSAENTLMDMVQLLFTRLPQFKEDPKWSANMKKLKMRTGGVDPSRISKRKRSPKPRSKRTHQQPPSQLQDKPSTVPEVSETQAPSASEGFEHITCEPLATTPAGVVDIERSFQAAAEVDETEEGEGEPTVAEEGQPVPTGTGEEVAGQLTESMESSEPPAQSQTQDSHFTLAVPGQEVGLKKVGSEAELGSEADRGSYQSEVADDNDSVNSADLSSIHEPEFVNPKGVRFTQPQQQQHNKEGYPLIPYGLPCVRELFRFLISLTNPVDRHNTDVMIHMGLSLLTVALETGADHISCYNSLGYLVKDELCRSLSMLLQSERLSLFAAALRVSFLLFESMRSLLKFQLEMYLTRLSEIVVSESPKITYDQREIALESIVQLWRIPGLVTELYLNYDCDLYCSNLFEELTKLLSKNAFPVSGLFTTHLLSLDALLTVVDSIEQHCHRRILSGTKSPAAAEGDASQVEGSAAGVEGENRPDPSGAAEPQLLPFRGPPSTGFTMAHILLQRQDPDSGKFARREQRLGPQIKPNRMAKFTAKIPSREELAEFKQKKKAYFQGTEYFNQKTAKGIAFLQEQGLLSTPLDPGEIVTFLKENPKLDKKMIGEYIGAKKNKAVLGAFVRSFNFEDTRIDEALRLYLETFRLPGEAPVISWIMEHFAEHWHKSNREPFYNADAAFTLTYGIIMLNVDQHNHNVKKQSIPMTMEQFKSNVSKVNGGKDFDEDMLEEIFTAIRNEEIVMPAEHTGLVKENYLWKVLLRRGATKEGVFLHAPTGAFDSELFTLIWGPTVAALSFVFDKSADESIIQKAVSGFRKCAMISAHNNMSDVFDNLVISLCKFTTLLSAPESPESIPATFGSNMKAQLAARTVFGLAHRHGDILREGWKNILDCMLQLFRAKLLPKSMIEVEDFADPSGKVSIIKEETTAVARSETGVLSSFVSYFSLSDSPSTKGPTPEELEAGRQAQSCVQDCHLDSLIADTKFLRHDSLTELVKALIAACQGAEEAGSLGGQYDEDAGVFFLELLVRVVLQNRDRVTGIWTSVRDHLYWIFVRSREPGLLVERAAVGLLRMAIRLLRREEMAGQVLGALRLLLVLPSPVLHSLARQLTYGLHELLRTNAANIHAAVDWSTLFTLLEVVGAGANPPPVMQVDGDLDVAQVLHDADIKSPGAQSDSEITEGGGSASASDRGYTSDSELYESPARHIPQHPHTRRASPELALRAVPDNGSWMLVNREESPTTAAPAPLRINQYSIELREELVRGDRRALLKSAETLAFLVRDAAHVTPHNFKSCVHTIRIFVEASVNGGHHRIPPRSNSLREKYGGGHPHKPPPRSRQHRESKMKKSRSSPTHLATAPSASDDEGEEEAALTSLHSLSIQLLDLMHTLHTRAASIFAAWAEEGDGEGGASGDGGKRIDAATRTLWATCWCPLLQGIARLCCDTRRQVRSQALTYLQRALLVHDLQTLSAVEWEACFNKVLFPLLTKLLENINSQDPSGMEETRMRASTLLCKVFLQHLSPLLCLTTFTALWLTILDFMEKYMKADSSDLLSEAIPENLKNMLLVMETAGIFQTDAGTESKLWRLTWDKIDTFLPNLRDDIFKPFEPEPKKIDRCGTTTTTESAAAPPSETEVSGSQHTGETGSTEQQQQCDATPAEDSQEVPHSPATGVQDVPLEGITVIPSASQVVTQQQGPAQRPESPLLSQSEESTPGSSYILHPPLPAVASSSPPGGSNPSRGLPGVHIPLLLNPDILQSTSIPYISPQKAVELAESQNADSPR
ncbi:Golgi-specific brefeldin A-resistance guanine nucleotide exchange factor 1-like isoform X2 [Littorina saxatilis]|uniref:Golgi-specific brefeldin A-resistance guanine nucleotide exchange factor 1-like isoform X2 n=1 Tax=Littorina saxatilis TaxID=31220 RepID=UPI0038B43989